ncbi:ABC transporter related [Clostridium bornimense]|uniref:ABC transporter related n=1 Tax=Clostridium bornimense TaxID=1216932 RepID=W6S2A4_9CLOT|nr:ABC transporter ATP-binding protein [Clostridium bornimense]CDM68412.1 ABC transporter related [Clostridium bornimense]
MKNEFYISIKDINKSYEKKQILFDISLNIPKGTIYGLLGPSGCGKTTLVKTIAGISNADFGDIRILGEKVPNIKVLSYIGYMAQSAALYPTISAYENLKFFGRLYNIKKNDLEKRISYVANIVNLFDHLSKKVDSFSGGMKQRLSLAIALLPNPKILILDEPTVGIDPVLRKSIWKELKLLSQSGVTILITTHIMDEAIKCDYLAMMRAGHIIATGTPKEIQEQSGTTNIEDAFIYYGENNKTVKGGDDNEN